MVHIVHNTCAEELLVRKTGKSQRSNQGGFWPHTKELGHYSAYDRELLKPKTTLIKSSVCVCMCVFQKPFKHWEWWLSRCSGMFADRVTS